MSEVGFKGWAVVEMMGHRQLIGECSEVEVAGSKLLRVDVPEQEGIPAFTSYCGASSIYALTPVSEAVARKLIESRRPRPEFVFDLRALPAPQGEMFQGSGTGREQALDDE